MNYVQHISPEKHGYIFVTLNPPYDVDPKKVFKRIDYEHPVIDGKVSPPPQPAVNSHLDTHSTTPQAVLLQREMASIQGTRGISYAGAWLSYGFHEDGFTSGLRAVVDYIPDVKPPFQIQYPDREPAKASIGLLFDFLEATRASTAIGALFSVVLGGISFVLSPFKRSSKTSKSRVD